MGMCKGCGKVFPYNEMENGLCKDCQDANVIVPEQKKPKEMSGQKISGIVLMIVGIVWGLFAFNLDTTVTSERQIVGEGEYAVDIPSVTVNNLGLMNQQRNHLTGAGVTVIVGVLLFALGGNRREDEE